MAFIACTILAAFGQKNKETETPPTQKPLNEQATADAWDAYNSGKYEAAITNARLCIDEFRGAASIMQDKLKKEKANLPTGAVSDDVKRKIQTNGLLNDVATCYFIEGRSAEKLGRKDQAMKAYERARKYTYARTWDTKGWFWSPAEAADGRIEGLR
jgi:tetratricopeptide (TPR) repeat protein